MKNDLSHSELLDRFREALEGAGLRPEQIVMDGSLQRCAVEGKPRGRDGAYIAHMDDPPSIWWQNFVSGDAGTWTAKSNGSLTPQDREKLRQRIEQDQAKRQQEQADKHAAAAQKARRILERAKPCPEEHPYLEAKRVRPVEGMRVTRFQGQDAVVYPLMDEHGEVVSLQNIFEDGSKRLLAGGRKRGCYFPIRGEDGPLLACEGLATGLSLHEATKLSVLVAVDAGNLETVARLARERYPDREIILCADNDTETEGNPGVTTATEAAKVIGGKLAVPTMPNGTKCDFNDAAVELGLDEVRRQLSQAGPPEIVPPPDQKPPREESHEPDPFDRRPFFRPVSELLSAPTPTQWLVKDHLDAGCFAEIFGESGSMKSFVAIDLAVAIAAESEWKGHPVCSNGPVFYVAGEGQGGLRKRIKARLYDAGHHDDVPLFVSRGGMQGTDDADVNRVVQEIISMAESHGVPTLVIIDTLARNFGAGDENKSQDMGRFIMNMDALRARLGCALLLIHHTGLANTERARGASALRAALDWEYRLTKQGDFRTLSCSKSKDFDPPPDMHFSPREVQLPPPWEEEDGRPMVSVVLDQADAPPVSQTKKRLSGQKLICRDALGECIHEATKGKDMTGEPTPRIHIDTWRTMAYRRGISQGDQGAKQRAFHRAVQDLLAMKVVEADGDLYALL